MTDSYQSLTVVDFQHGQAPGIYKFTKEFDKNILGITVVMETLNNAMESLNKDIQIINDKITFYGEKQTKTQKRISTINTIASALGIIALGTMIGYTPVKEGEAPTKMQTLHNGMAAMGQKLIISSNVMVNVVSADYSAKEGQYESSSTSLQGYYSQLEPQIDESSRAMDNSNKTISANMKAIKDMLENDFSSKSQSVYLS